jgi:hypothetical protein
MKVTALACWALSSLGIVAFSACGGQRGDGVMPAGSASEARNGSATFKYAGKEQIFKVPRNVTQLRVFALGGNGSSQYDDHFGFGARVSALIPVTPGERLYVLVGGNASKGIGGFNGGADGGVDGCCAGIGGGGGGGGASDVRAGGKSISDRIVVAAGGGGEGGEGGENSQGGRGGNGGGLRGSNGGVGKAAYSDCNGRGGRGASQSDGGAGGAGSDCGYKYNYQAGGTGEDGTRGSGGAGGNGGSKGAGKDAGAGGGGGGGYYGGGGGGGGGDSKEQFGIGAGGGGGSSYVESSATSVHFYSGWLHVGGLVVFDW